MARVIGWIFSVSSRAIHVLVGSGPCCRFYPSCSQYGKTAVERFGFWSGSGLLARRLVRCHPWGGSGFDPVPSPLYMVERNTFLSKGKQNL